MTDLNEQIAESKSFSEAVIANIRQPLLVLDKSLHIVSANHAFHQVFNLKTTETEGALIYNLGNKQWNIPSLRKLLEEILPKRKKITDYEVKHRFPDIGERTMLLNAQEIIRHSESQNLILLSIEDVTDANKADEGNATLATIVQSSEYAIISKTLKGIVTSWNLGAEKLFGYTRAEMIGQSILKIIPPDRINEEPEIIRKIQEGETIAHFDTQRVAKDGRLIDISLTISPIKDNNAQITGALKIARDITDQIESRKKIEASEKRMHNLIYSSPSAMAILDGEDLVITTANETIINIWGKGKDVIGKKYFDVLPELADQGYREIFTGVYKTGVPHNAIEMPVRFLHNGEPTLNYYNFILYPQYNMNNEIDGIGIIATDVTAQALVNKSIKESEERFRSLTQTIPQLIWVTDAQGNAEFASSRWKEYSGVEPGGEKEWEEIVHPDDYAGINESWMKSLATANVYKSEVRLKNRAGDYRWHSVVAEPVLDSENKIIKWVGAFTDINDQKLKDEKKDEFMGIASHEMKTPLTTAKAYLQMLELTLSDTAEEAKMFALKASQSVDRLNELIGELLDVSKIQFGKLNYSMTTFNFNEMIVGTVENIQLTSPESIIIKTGKVNGAVMGDKNRLQQVVINLLSNAIKYSPHSESVFITLAQEKDRITVAVKDTGIGIAEQSLHKIFEKYHRVEEHAVQFQGMGVGLFISYEIIERHHGKLWVESEVGKGSTFYFTLPVNGVQQSE
ncbi:PAS domain S-box protein [Cryomorpha ignava]|uniref:histidine kinase n=1 Tax=Cryomorpha ignava TaxID=101383 RepID=A0A7K3WRR8_9FLAO|nr:PAS domain S-box protein [Cryomorpha ignava]NEN24216.1 PAS domain S-box protein [Cryomorpha ignava]